MERATDTNGQNIAADDRVHMRTDAAPRPGDGSGAGPVRPPDPVLEPSIVEVECLADRMVRVHVECEKRPGLMENLVATLENAGLLLLQAQISAPASTLTLDALGVQDEGTTIEIETLRHSLLSLINNVN